MKKTAHPVANTITFIISVALIVYSVWQLYQLYTLRYQGNTASGVITGYKTQESDAKFTWNRKPVHAPIFEYTPADGEKISVATSVFKKTKIFSIGQSIQVYYRADAPYKAQFEGGFPWKRKMYIGLIGIIGVIITTVPFFRKIVNI